MYRQLADRALGWSLVTERRFSACRIDSDNFRGWRSALYLAVVREPLWVEFRGEPCCVCDNGHLWVQYFPDGTHHTVTCMFDRDDALIQWYIDICAAWGVSDEGMPWFDDLYLDIVVTPEGGVELLDADELEWALASGDISLEDYQRAQDEARMVLGDIEDGRFALIELSLSDVADARRELGIPCLRQGS